MKETNIKNLDKVVAETNKEIKAAMQNNTFPLCNVNTISNRPVSVGIYVDGLPELIPEYKTRGASGMDIRANIEEPIILKPLERQLVPTGVYVNIPEGYELQLRPRSGIAWKRGLTLINCIGTIDDDYIGHIQVPLVNISNEIQTIEPFERIAQLVLMKVDKVEWEHYDSTKTFEAKDREGGFGSTGSK